MLKKSITFKDLDGNTITEDFYFNISKAELAEMELSHGGGMEQYLKTIIASGNGGMIMAAFREILVKAYGKRSEDNRSFIKTDQLALEFVSSDAYSELFMELVTNATAGAEFVRGIMPADIQSKMGDTPATLELAGTPVRKSADDYSREELLSMPQAQFEALVGKDPMKMHQSHLQLAFMRKASGK